MMREHSLLIILIVLAQSWTSNSFRCGEGDTCRLLDDPNNVAAEFQKSAVFCRDKLNVSYGEAFEECTMKRMGTRNVSFPSKHIRTHSFRNFTCDEDHDKSPLPLETIQLEYRPNINEFYMNSKGIYRKLSSWRPSTRIEARPFRVQRGMSVRSAKDLCDTIETCFTFTILRTNTLERFSSSSRKRILLTGTASFYSLEAFLDTSETAWFTSANAIGTVTYTKTQFRYKDFIHFTGFIERDQTLRYKAKGTSLRKILDECNFDRECGGFTFKGDDLSTVRVELKRAENMKHHANMTWHSFIHIRSYGNERNVMLETKKYDVDVYRQRPMVIAVVRNFGTKKECEFMRAQTGWDYAKVNDKRGAKFAKVDYRRLAKAMPLKQPLFDFTSSVSEYFVRNFAIVHGLTGHAVWPAGQEPISLIKYNVSGEEFRPHCDGDCSHTPNKGKGHRVATSILYCQASERGGHTHFTSAKIKLKPREGDLLVFSYVHPDGTNDYSRLSEHSGCPIKEGEKFIATQWFRKDVSELKDWVAFQPNNNKGA